MDLRRYLHTDLLNDLEKKMVLLSGPRQVGKTTLSKSLVEGAYYLNYDVPSDRPIILKAEWPRDASLVVLDELHKLKRWKSLLKGVYDDRGVRPRILVTGSSRLDIVKKMGDSLAGRHRSWRLHPLCCKELADREDPEVVMRKILSYSGFPEPYVRNDFTEYRRWARSHLDVILRNDLVDLETVSSISGIETLVELLTERVGQMVSYESLARDLRVSPSTVKRWTVILENLFIIFRVTPWSKRVSRSLVKAPKFYFYDCARVNGDIGARFENFVACSLIKEIDLVNDRLGGRLALHYFRNREKHELDFVVSNGTSVRLAIEAKYGDTAIAPGFRAFRDTITIFGADTVQLVATLERERETDGGLRIVNAARWLATLNLAPYVT